MFNLITINIDKKLSLFSVLFMLVSIVAIFIISIFEASFNLSAFKTLDEEFIIMENFVNETISLMEIIQILFIILLVELELFHNTDNFDSYFISLKGKKKYFIAKISSYVIIVFFYTSFVFLGFMIIYMLRFKNTKLIFLILKCYGNYLIYFLVFFFIAYLVMLLFKNYFSMIIIFIYYWITKMIESKNEIILTLFPKITLNLEKVEVSFQTNLMFIICFIFILFWLCKKVYDFKDLKINS